MKNPSCLFVFCIAMCLATLARAQTPAGTAFTYQGQLKQNGQPFSGNASFVFDLFSANTGGSSLGTVSMPNQGVSNGLFTTSLDFGATPFSPNEARWVQVSINGIALSPRQRLTPSPFSLATRGLNVSSTGNIGIGTNTPTDKLEIANGSLILNGTGGFGRIVFKSTAVGGHQYEWYPDSAGVGGLGLYDRTTDYSPLTVASSGNVGIGTIAPSSKLTVAGVIASTSGGIRFPDGTTQISALPPGCASGQVPKWNGAAWGCANDLVGSGVTTVNGAAGPALTIQGSGAVAVSTFGNIITVSAPATICTFGNSTYSTGATCSVANLGNSGCPTGQGRFNLTICQANGSWSTPAPSPCTSFQSAICGQ